MSNRLNTVVFVYKACQIAHLLNFWDCWWTIILEVEGHAKVRHGFIVVVWKWDLGGLGGSAYAFSADVHLESNGKLTSSATRYLP